MTVATLHTDWIMTASGRQFWPLEPRAEDVAIEDIAHHLANLCRFTGAVREFYSVAQHSVLVGGHLAKGWSCANGESAMECSAIAGLYGLLHDASEAYLIDVPRPLKHAAGFSAYRSAESAVQAAVYRAFFLDPANEPPNLKSVDRRMLRTEQRDLMPPAAHGEFRDDVAPYPEVITPWPPEVARHAFLAFYELMIRSIELARMASRTAVAR